MSRRWLNEAVHNGVNPKHNGEKSADDKEARHVTSVSGSANLLVCFIRKLDAVKLPPLLVYTVLRLLAFAVPFAILVLFVPILREQWWLAGVFAALIGLALSILVLRKPLDSLTKVIVDRREQARADLLDEDVEDAEL